MFRWCADHLRPPDKGAAPRESRRAARSSRSLTSTFVMSCKSASPRRCGRHRGALCRSVARATLSSSTAATVWKPAASQPRSIPPAPVNKEIARTTEDNARAARGRSGARDRPPRLARAHYAVGALARRCRQLAKIEPYWNLERPRIRENPVATGIFSQSGRPDLNRGPHRPELRARSTGAARSPCKVIDSALGADAARFADFAVDFSGLGREIGLLPKLSGVRQ